MEKRENKNIMIEVKKWLNLAETDLKVSKILEDSKNYSNSVYHSQQASEKAVKSILILLGEQIYEHKVSTEFYDVVFNKYPYDYIEEIYFNLTELETHWLKSRYILKTRQNVLIDPLEVYDKKKSSNLYKKSEQVIKLTKKFLKEEFDFNFN